MIPGWIISILTFPGVIAHEIGHMFFCKRFNVKIHKVCYFRFGNPAGYVIHDDPQNFKQSFFIDIGPFIVSNAFAIVAFVFAASFMDSVENLGLFFGWLGVSFAMNSFPSKGDAKALWAVTKKHSEKDGFLKLIGYPFAVIIYIANLLSFIWFDLIWAILLYGAVASIV
jgi:hypothetical protein